MTSDDLALAEAQATCLNQFRLAACMTDSLAALTALADKPSTARDEALHTFYERAKANKEANPPAKLFRTW